MQLKFCPQCGGMEISPAQAGDKCRRCNYLGPMDHGSMDRINEVRKRYRGGAAPAMGLPSANTSPSTSASAASAGGLSGLLPSNSGAPSTPKLVPSNAGAQQLAERLKALKGKSTGDVEFL